MKSTWTLASSAAIVFAVATWATAVQAQPCALGCATQGVTCAATARMAMRSCRVDCRANATPEQRHDCATGCSTTFRSDMTTCRTDLGSCVGACDASASAASADPAAAACQSACGPQLAACARQVVTDSKACVAGCRTAEDRPTCLGDCVATAKARAATCGTDVASCLGDCGPATPPTTVPPPGCGEVADGHCGGPCPTPGQVCADVDGTCSCTNP